MSSNEAAKHDVWRLFVAVDLPDDVRERLRQIRQTLKTYGWTASWTNPETAHLTMRFFGDRPILTVNELGVGLHYAMRDIAPFELSTSRMGVFPNLVRPRVIWLGVRDRSGTLSQLAATIEAKSRELGVKPENRPFQPHLTVARVRREKHSSISDVEQHFGEIDRMASISFSVDHATLYRSDLKRGGAIHTVVQRFDFGTEA